MDVDGWDEWTNDVHSKENLNIRVVGCKPHSSSGMLQYVEISTKGNIDDVISKIRANPNVEDSEFTKTDNSRASGLVITKNSPLCRSISDKPGFCTTCLLSGDSQHNHWRITLSGDDSFKSLLSDLDEMGVSVNVRDSRTLQNGTLTFDQDKIIRVAHDQGYFEFPRKVNLTALAERLHMSKSNLEEILRRAEHKIVANYSKRGNENHLSTTR
jgi:predicted DNA binding protein